MSQIGIEGGERETNYSLHYPFDSIHRANGETNDLKITFEDFNREGATALLIVSVIGLLGNLMAILLVIVTKTLQKPNAAFLVHQCLLDTIKSAYCLVFSKSLIERQAPPECAIIGASYIVFVTTSAFNILATTINEIYHFTNEQMGIEPSSKCCVLFGLGITWFASIITNLGVAFLPANSTFDRAIGYCTLMNGVTGNYLLHVLWIALITVGLILSTIYLRKFWSDINDRENDELANLNHSLSLLHASDHNPSKKNQLHVRSIQKTTKSAKRNFALLTGMVITFFCFWYPLFLLTLSDPQFKAKHSLYKTFTILAWCHSSLTPIFFIGYNIDSFKDLCIQFIGVEERDSTIDVSTMEPSIPRHHQLTSESGSMPRSPQRPNSLNVTPSYLCRHHFPSGVCIVDHCVKAAPTAEHITTTKGRLGESTVQHSSCEGTPVQRFPSSSKSFEQAKQKSKLTEDLWMKRSSSDTNGTMVSGQYKFNRMGSAYETLREERRLEIIGNTSEAVSKLMEPKISPGTRENYIHGDDKSNRAAIKLSLTGGGNEFINGHPYHYRANQRLCNSATMPNHINHYQCLSIPSKEEIQKKGLPTRLTVHRLSTGCIMMPKTGLSTEQSGLTGQWV